MPEGSIGFCPALLEDALRAERLRLQRQGQRARESAVFFLVSACRPAPATLRQTFAETEAADTAGASDGSAAPASAEVYLQLDQDMQR